MYAIRSYYVSVNGYYNDKQIGNSGPMPPTVGSSTTYTFHWSVTNIANDLEDISVESSLPSGIKWTGQIYPSDANITYSERTNQIVWNVGSVAAGSGIISPAKEVAFQVVITSYSIHYTKLYDTGNKSRSY